MAAKTYYPQFTRDLTALAAFLGSKRSQLISRSSFTTGDTAALDALIAALNAAVVYFPNYTEPS